MPKQSAGLLPFRHSGGEVQVLLVHPGGPFWTKKDLGAWSIPKGEVDPGEEPLACARREFEEEIGTRPEGEFISLGEIRQSGGKLVHAWAFEGDCDTAKIRSNTFSMVWPPKSGKLHSFVEIDRAEWFTLEEARHKIIEGQVPFLECLSAAIAHRAKS